MHMEEGGSVCGSWDELAPDVLALIFEKLLLREVFQVLPLVCKSWRRVVKGPYCWTKIDIKTWSWGNHPLRIDRMLRTLVLRSSGSLRELSVSCVNDQMLSFIAEHAGSLRTLILEACSVSDSVMEQVAPKLSSLTTLKMTYYDEISTRGLEAMGTSCNELVSLSWKVWHGMRYRDDEALAISRTMPKLKRLNLDGLRIKDSAVLNILAGCPELESLDIRGCRGVRLDGKFFEENYPKVEVRFDRMSDSDSDTDDYYLYI